MSMYRNELPFVGSEVPPFAFQATEGKQGSRFSLAADCRNSLLIEKETQTIANKGGKISNVELI
jgi:hypothetical protein